MSATPYATLAQVKAQCGIPLSDTQDDVLLTAALAATTTKINEKTGRPGSIGFNLGTGPVTYYRRATHPEYLSVPDLADVSSLVVKIGNSGQPSTFTTVVDPASYECLPENNLAIGRPVDTLRSIYAVWPTYPYVSLSITAVPGWPAVPDTVVEAQIMWTAKLWRRKDSIDGIAGQSDYGAIRVGRMDPDIEDLLADITRPGFA